MRDKITLCYVTFCPGSAPGFFSKMDMPKTPHPVARCLTNSSSLSWMSDLLTHPSHPAEEANFGYLYITRSFWSLPTPRWGLGCRWTDTLRASSPLFPTTYQYSVFELKRPLKFSNYYLIWGQSLTHGTWQLVWCLVSICRCLET